MRRFKVTLFIVLISTSFYSSARSQDHGFGAGIIIGEPTGFSFKGWLDGKSAIDAADRSCQIDHCSFRSRNRDTSWTITSLQRSSTSWDSGPEAVSARNRLETIFRTNGWA